MKQCVDPESTKVSKANGGDKSEGETERQRTRDEDNETEANLGEKETKGISVFRPVRRASPDDLIGPSFLSWRLVASPWRH